MTEELAPNPEPAPIKEPPPSQSPAVDVAPIVGTNVEQLFPEPSMEFVTAGDDSPRETAAILRLDESGRRGDV